VAIDGLGHYALRWHSREPAVVIGYASPPDHAYTAALERLTAAFGSR
jgi:GntR family transcriptional regulator / MocR family aminotransferase